MATNAAPHATTDQAWTRAVVHFMRSRVRLIVAAFWILAIVVYWLATQQVAPTPVAKIKLLAELFMMPGWGPLIFVAVYAIQPLVFFPTFLMTIAAGILYGPVWGLTYSVIGAIGASLICYTVGRLLGARILSGVISSAQFQEYVKRLQRNTFETVLVLSLLHAPFDMLNYLAGILRLSLRQFAAATFIGLIPGGLPFVLFGSSLGSIENLSSGRPDINLPLLGLSFAIGLTAILVSRYIRRRTEEPME